MKKSKSMALMMLGVLMSASGLWAQEQAAVAAGGMKEAAQMQLQTAKSLIGLVLEFIVKYSFQVLGGIIVLVAGWFIAKYIAGIVARLLERQRIDVTVSKFIVSAAKWAVMAFAVIVALGKFGIETAPLIAGISVAGFGLSFALQGPLSNYASGATLIFTKPFKVGDIIEVAGVMGEVQDMQLARTEVRTVDGTTIVIPNRHVIGEIIHNYSDTKRVDINVGVSYKCDVPKAIDIVRDVILKDTRVAKAPHVGISAFADSSVNIYARLWCKQDDYWNVMFDVHKNILHEFKKNSIEIPFPQRDVHLFQEKG